MKTFRQFIFEANDAGYAERKAYYDRIYNYAKKHGDRFPELTAAQAGLESGWGKSLSGKNNPLGQKASAGQRGTSKGTFEYGSGGRYNTSAKFQDFDSEEDSVRNRVKRWSYKYGDAKDAETAARYLQLPPGAKIPGTNQTSHGVYATAPDYSSRITQIARQYGKPDSADDTSKKQKNTSSPKSSPKSRSNIMPKITMGSLNTPSPTRVLAKLKGKSGELDKTTNKFVERKWSDTEGNRYKQYGGK
jgi:flagellum-specific peptidoglycan hydrolase FlgJ